MVPVKLDDFTTNSEQRSATYVAEVVAICVEARTQQPGRRRSGATHLRSCAGERKPVTHKRIHAQLAVLHHVFRMGERTTFPARSQQDIHWLGRTPRYSDSRVECGSRNYRVSEPNSQTGRNAARATTHRH